MTKKPAATEISSPIQGELALSEKFIPSETSIVQQF